MRTQYRWDAELKSLEKSGMEHVEAALKIAGFSIEDNDGTFECNVCGQEHPTDIMIAVVRGGVPVLACLNCADEENLPTV